MVCFEQALPAGTCSVRRRQRPCLVTAVVIIALAVAVLMGAGSAFVAAAAAVPRRQSLAPGLSGHFAGAATVSATARPHSAMAALSWMPSMPQTCDDDFDCNGGRANFPLQCFDMVVLKVCVDPDDFERSRSRELAYVPIPVRAEDGPQQTGR